MNLDGHRAICVDCNRPFNPASPGATATRGPTCAKNAALKAKTSANQLALDPIWLDEIGLGQGERDPATGPKSKISVITGHRIGRLSFSKIPKQLHERFKLAKMAFDELMREFCSEDTICYGDEALNKYKEVKSIVGVEEHSFVDPLLDWLEPEHNLFLLLVPDRSKAYYWRLFNGTYTFLELDPARSPVAQRNIAHILAFTTAQKMYRQVEAMHQLSLFDSED